MRNQKYGPQTVEIKIIIKRLRTATLEQIKSLSDARTRSRSEESWNALDAARDAAWDTEWGEELKESLDLALNEAWSASSKEVWYYAFEAVCDALLALLVRDLITPDQFDALYVPWASVMEQQ